MCRSGHVTRYQLSKPANHRLQDLAASLHWKLVLLAKKDEV